jgi:hypothetical protein
MTEYLTMLHWKCRNSKAELYKGNRKPNSKGLFDSALPYALGWSHDVFAGSVVNITNIS